MVLLLLLDLQTLFYNLVFGSSDGAGEKIQVWFGFRIHEENSGSVRASSKVPVAQK